MTPLPKPIEYCLGHLVKHTRNCEVCHYDPVRNPMCAEYRPGNLYAVDVQEFIDRLKESSMQLEESYFQEEMEI